MVRERTLGGEVSYSGVGLHSGKEVRMRLLPAGVGRGIIFRRVDLPDAPEIKARPSNVGSTLFCTSLVAGDVRVHTVEHLMAAFAGMGIDNAIVEIDSVELPVGDGSARVFTDLLSEAGVEEQDAEARVFSVDEPLWVSDKGGKYLIALPGEGFRISYIFANDHPAVGDQFAEFEISKETFSREIAPARTVAFLDVIKALRERNMGRGGNAEVVVVVGEREILTPLRFPDEIVRHKILDLIGDLWLLGRVEGHFIGVKSGHTINNRLARRLEERMKGC